MFRLGMNIPVSYSLPLDQLWGSVLILQIEPTQMRIMIQFIYGYND